MNVDAATHSNSKVCQFHFHVKSSSFLCHYIASNLNGRQHNYRNLDECNCTFSLNTKKDLHVEERAMHTIVALKMYLQKIAFSEE